eukprot:3278749-Rhodomonas_salina.2
MRILLRISSTGARVARWARATRNQRQDAALLVLQTVPAGGNCTSWYKLYQDLTTAPTISRAIRIAAYREEGVGA